MDWVEDVWRDDGEESRLRTRTRRDKTTLRANIRLAYTHTLLSPSFCTSNTNDSLFYQAPVYSHQNAIFYFGRHLAHPR